MTKVVFIGAGNLATQLALRMHQKGFEIVQVYSYTTASAQLLATKVGCCYTHCLTDINPDADLYIFAVKDAVLQETLRSVAPNKGLWVHTAGSIPAAIFAGHVDRWGVFYPLQTFNKERQADFEKIPFFIESNRAADTQCLIEWAQQLSPKVYEASSEQRKHLHLAAVFACNFTNHMYAIAQELLKAQGLPFDAIAPLIEETAQKVQAIPALQAQTGPAIRYDENVMNGQLEMLDDERLKQIYQTISQNIHLYTKLPYGSY